MATGNIVRVWQDQVNAYAAVAVAEGGAQGNVEYIGAVSLTAELKAVGFPGQTWADLTNAQKKAALVAAVKAVRDAQQATQSALSGITGSVTI
jgi:hypothetical protein